MTRKLPCPTGSLDTTVSYLYTRRDLGSSFFYKCNQRIRNADTLQCHAGYADNNYMLLSKVSSLKDCPLTITQIIETLLSECRPCYKAISRCTAYSHWTCQEWDIQCHCLIKQIYMDWSLNLAFGQSLLEAKRHWISNVVSFLTVSTYNNTYLTWNKSSMDVSQSAQISFYKRYVTFMCERYDCKKSFCLHFIATK